MSLTLRHFAIICLKYKRLKVSDFNSFRLMKIEILDRFGKSRETLDSFMFLRAKKNAKSETFA